MWGWGNNDKGQLGQNNTTDYSSPKQVGSDTTWSKISGNAVNSMAAIKTDGTLWGWGYGVYGNFGVNNRTDYSSPVQIFGSQTNWASINMGPGSLGAVNTDGELWLSGWNTYGNLAQNNRTRYSSPVQVPGTTWSQDDDVLKMGFSMTWALKTDGTIWSWGYNQVGQLMINETHNRISSPVQVGAGMDWSDNNYSGLWMTDGGSFILGAITP